MDKLDHDIVALAGKMTRAEIAKTLQTSRAKVNRVLARNNIRTGQPKTYPKQVVDSVMAFYKNHTLNETQEHFPDITVRSIIDRNNKCKKLDTWDFQEKIKHIRMATIYPILQISSRLTGRSKSSIDKMFHRHDIRPKTINGIALRLVKHHVKPGIKISQNGNMKVVTWIEFEKHLDTKDQTISSCVRALALFQKWIIKNDSNA